MRYRDALQFWDLASALSLFRSLALVPGEANPTITGSLVIDHAAYGFQRIRDSYEITCVFPTDGFPLDVPRAREIGGRIEANWHRHPNGDLCLASERRQKVILDRGHHAANFITNLVIPYLYSRSYFEISGEMPFGELAHGTAGLIQDYEHYFGITGASACIELLRLAAMHPGDANQRRCPCGSGRRLGRCHQPKVNGLRRILGQEGCRHEAKHLSDSSIIAARSSRWVR